MVSKQETKRLSLNRREVYKHLRLPEKRLFAMAPHGMYFVVLSGLPRGSQALLGSSKIFPNS